jgi:hypothetical protein
MLSDIRFQGFRGRAGRRRQLADAAEAHGSLCGALCSMAPYKMQDWVNEILPDGASLSDESSAMIERVFSATATSFGEQGMEFEPLLPDDEQPLNGRANALAYGAPAFYMAWAPARFRISRPSTARSEKSSEISPRYLALPAMMPTRMNPTNRPMPNWSSSSGSRPRWCSRNYCRSEDRSTRLPSSGCTERRWIARSSRAGGASSCA